MIYCVKVKVPDTCTFFYFFGCWGYSGGDCPKFRRVWSLAPVKFCGDFPVALALPNCLLDLQPASNFSRQFPSSYNLS